MRRKGGAYSFHTRYLSSQNHAKRRRTEVIELRESASISLDHLNGSRAKLVLTKTARYIYE